MEGSRTKRCHLLTLPRDVGSTVSQKAGQLPPRTPDIALLPVVAVPGARGRPPLLTLRERLSTAGLSPAHPTALLCLPAASGRPGPSQGLQRRAPTQALLQTLSFPLTPSRPHHAMLGPYPLHSAPPSPLVSPCTGQGQAEKKRIAASKASLQTETAV